MTDHDPMLDGITRWKVGKVWDDPSPDGTHVLFSDLPALIARVREDEREKALDEVRDMVANMPVALVAVERSPFLNQQGMQECDDPDKYPHGLVQVFILSEIAAIRAREEKP